ncbi:MAG: hypothetical protein AAF514_20680, partial [Verrucomicrobiota bacterium]
MSAATSPEGIPEPILKKINAFHRTRKRTSLVAGLLQAGAILLVLLLVVLIVDASVVLFDQRLRWALTLSTVAGAVAVFYFACVRPFLRRRRVARLAREIDQAVPALEERWSTVASLSEAARQPELMGASSLIAKVQEQAADQETDVEVGSIVSREPLRKA